MIRTDKLRWTLGALALAALGVAAWAPLDALGDARELAKAGKWAEVESKLRAHLATSAPTAAVDGLLGQALARQGKNDEAALLLDRALSGMSTPDKELQKELKAVDPLVAKRDKWLKDASKELLEKAKALEAGGQKERALEVLETAQPLARGPELAGIAELTAKIRASGQQLSLDSGRRSRPPGGWPLYKLETAHYRIEARLKPADADRLGRMMDSIYQYYLQVYFAGNPAYLEAGKATIYVHATRADMMLPFNEGRPDGDPMRGTVEGFFRNMPREVHVYDTSTTAGSLEPMIGTLFHEASHHFMAMLTRDGRTPAWINEGTSSFFEGASAMADGSVLWPDAARDRLEGLYRALTASQPGAPATPADAKQAGPANFLNVISYNNPREPSYPGDYYQWGWGLVYFFQQYEDPATLQYPYRKLYDAALKELKGETIADSKGTFARQFTGSVSPLGHASLEDFEVFWRTWIKDTIYPLHFGGEARTRRLAEVERYRKAAAVAAASKTPAISEKELLLRALGHLDFVRSRLDKADAPDAKVLLLQADLFEKIGEPRIAAPILEDLLELYEKGTWLATEAEVKSVSDRLNKLDKANAAWRDARTALRKHSRKALDLVNEYRNQTIPMPLRAYTLADVASKAFGGANGLAQAVEELKDAARSSGVQGPAVKLGGAVAAWKPISKSFETQFDVKPGRIVIEAGKACGRLCSEAPIKGDYELRARLTRQGEAKDGSQHGLVIAGTPEGECAAIVIDASGALVLKRLGELSGPGRTEKDGASIELENAPAFGTAFDLVVSVTEDGGVDVTVGTEGPFPMRMGIDKPDTVLAGVYVKSGSLLVENLTLRAGP
jgi:hypothetical protein